MPIARRNLVRLAILLAGVFALAGAQRTIEHFERIPKNFGVVAEGRVTRSGRLTPQSLRYLAEKEGVRTIIDLGGYEPGSEQEARIDALARKLGVTRYIMRLEGDGRGNPNVYVEALRLMADPGMQPLHVHCAAGSERTGAAVLLYRQIVEGASPQAVVDETFSHGHNPNRNRRMFAYLIEWSDDIERAYREGGSIPGLRPIHPKIGLPGVDGRKQWDRIDADTSTPERADDEAPDALVGGRGGN